MGKYTVVPKKIEVDRFDIVDEGGKVVAHQNNENDANWMADLLSANWEQVVLVMEGDSTILFFPTKVAKIGDNFRRSHSDGMFGSLPVEDDVLICRSLSDIAKAVAFLSIKMVKEERWLTDSDQT